MSVLWTAAEMEAATLGQASAPFEAGGISIDTRTLRPGDLFVALQGEARDGHDFVAAAFDARAAAALVARDPGHLPKGAELVTVGHTQRGLEDLARAARVRTNAHIVAVTGSAGKTTTKEMLRLAFGALGRTHASAASYNNQWGVPLTLAAMPRDTEFGVIEIGMNHFGEIRALAGFARPHVALITTVAPAHLEFFGNCEAIADAKSEIFEGLVPGGTALIPGDSPYAGRLLARARQAHVGRILTFGSTTGADARLVRTTEDRGGQTVVAEILGRPLTIKLAAPGAHIASNAVGALLAVAEAGGDVLNAAAALSRFEALKGRGAQFRVPVSGGTVEVIDESYNANPASMTAALALLGAAPAKGRRIAVLGDMLEMGPGGTAYHAAIAADIERASVDLVFANGKQMQALWEALPPSRRGAYGTVSSDIAPKLVDALTPGDVVLVKGSLSSNMAVVIDALKKKMAG